MSKTLTLEGDVNAVDTLVRLTAQGSLAAPSLLVPAGSTKIKHIYAAIAGDGAAAGSVVSFLRIGGNAVKNGEQTLMFAGLGGQAPQAGSDTAPHVMRAKQFKDVDIEVEPSDTLDISAEMAGADPGDTTIAVTLVFE